MIRVSMGAISFWGHPPRPDQLDETLKRAQKTGCAYLELEHFVYPGGIESTNPEELLQKLEGRNLKISGLYAPGFGGHNDREVRASVRSTLAMISLAERLGCDRIVSTGRTTRREIGLIGAEMREDLVRVAGDYMNNLVMVLRGVLPQAEKKKVKICLENHYGNQIEFISDYDKIFSELESPQLGITIDTGHFHASKVDVYKLIDKYPNKIFNVHVKDMIGTNSVPIGRGETDNPGYIGKLSEIGYDGFLTVELEMSSLFRDRENLDKYVVGARMYLERIIQALES